MAAVGRRWLLPQQGVTAGRVALLASYLRSVRLNAGAQRLLGLVLHAGGNPGPALGRRECAGPISKRFRTVARHNQTARQNQGSAFWLLAWPNPTGEVSKLCSSIVAGQYRSPSMLVPAAARARLNHE